MLGENLESTPLGRVPCSSHRLSRCLAQKKYNTKEQALAAFSGGKGGQEDKLEIEEKPEML